MACFSEFRLLAKDLDSQLRQRNSRLLVFQGAAYTSRNWPNAILMFWWVDLHMLHMLLSDSSQTWGSFMVLCTASIPLMGQKPCQLHCKVANTRMDGSRYSSTTGWTSFRIRIITREKHRPLYRYIASCDFHLLVPFLAALTTSSVLVQTTSSGWMAILLVIAALSLSKASLMKFCLSSLAGKCFGSIGWSHES